MEAIAVTIMLQIGITIAQFVSVLKVKQVSITLFLGVIQGAPYVSDHYISLDIDYNSIFLCHF